MKKKNLLIVAPNLNSGGTREFLNNLVKFWDSEKVQLTVIYNESYKGLILPKGNQIKFFVLPLSKKYYLRILTYFYCFFILTPFLVWKSQDAVFYPGGFGFGFGKPKILSFHNILPFLNKKELNEIVSMGRFRIYLLRLLTFLSVQNHFGIIYLSEFGKSKIEKFSSINFKRTVIIENGVDDIFLKIRIKHRKIDPNVLISLIWLSDITSYKNFEYVVLFLQYLRELKLKFVLNIFGRQDWKPEPDILKIFNSLVNENFIILHGFSDRKIIVNFIKKSDCAIYFSKSEMSPVSFFELLASRIPVIVNNSRPITDYQINKNLIISDLSQPSNFYKILEKILSGSPEIKNSYSPESWANTINKYIKYFERVLYEERF